MNVLVVAATELEIAPFQRLNKTNEVLITGVGVAATIYHLTRRLISAKYDLVIQAGIAGTFNRSLEMASVVIVKKDTFGDAGIVEKESYTTLFEAGLAKNDPPFKDGWLYNTHPLINNSSLKAVTAITVNTISDNSAQTKRYIEKFSPDIESMEGAGLHFTCLQEKVPFIQLRSISNLVGTRDKSQWHIKDAIYNLCDELETLLNSVK